jgi:ferric-dicitrate binding protein FerR (iron transport regulator)
MCGQVDGFKFQAKTSACRFALVALIALGFALFAGDAAAQVAGSVSALQGQATIVRAGKSMAAAYGTQVQVADQITTAPNSRVTVTLTDGTQLELAEASNLVIDRDTLNPDGSRAATEVKLLGGLVHSLVRFAPGNAPNYQVNTPNAVAAARGTDYDTAYVTGQSRDTYKGCLEFTDVAVFDGTVEVSNSANPTAGSVKLGKGQKTTVPCGLVPDPMSKGAIAAIGVLGIGGAAAGAVIGLGASGFFSSGKEAPAPITSSR